MEPEPAAAEDPWAVLEIPVTADDAAVRAAYRAAVRRYPPEADPGGFKRIRRAYEALRDPAARTRTLLGARLVLPELPPLKGADLGVRPFAPPGREELLEDLRRVILAGSELERRDFSCDLRPPPA